MGNGEWETGSGCKILTQGMCSWFWRVGENGGMTTGCAQWTEGWHGWLRCMGVLQNGVQRRGNQRQRRLSVKPPPFLAHPGHFCEAWMAAGEAGTSTDVWNRSADADGVCEGNERTSCPHLPPRGSAASRWHDRSGAAGFVIVVIIYLSFCQRRPSSCQ